jgi:hypothetical protein
VERCFLQQHGDADRISSLNYVKLFKASQFAAPPPSGLPWAALILLRSSSSIDAVFFLTLCGGKNLHFAISFTLLGMHSWHRVFRTGDWLWSGDCF